MTKNNNCCEMKYTIRGEEEKKNIQRRMNILIGQMNGIKTMIDEDRYCEDVIMQLLAIDKGIQSLSDSLLERHIKTCITEEVKKENYDSLDEVIRIIRRYR